MLFSSLYSMLPQAKGSLVKGGYDSKSASWIMIGCFLGGVVGIQIISRVMHHFVPHNVVDCEHQHDDEERQKETQHHEHHDRDHDHDNGASKFRSHRKTLPQAKTHRGYARPQMQQQQPSGTYFHANATSLHHASTIESESDSHPTTRDSSTERRPTLQSRITTTVSKLTSGKDASCECDGPCYGYSDPCQINCFKTVNAGGGVKVPKATAGINRPAATKSLTATESTPLLTGVAEEPLTRPHTHALAEGAADLQHDPNYGDGSSDDSSATVALDGGHHLQKVHSHESSHNDEGQQGEHHHHHVPTNAFLNIGLQTSIAIALHKLPEGFITYATNHANPKLGVSVFLALFIHNITEGFAMALPLYLAINNRIKAMLISFVLGGLSQPLGAAVAAIWFKLAGQSNWAPSESGYGAMFAITAGIMASVALQLFAEALDLTHSKHLCMIGAFIGMAILGISSALTA